MQSNILKYIENEKDIARCRVSILEKLSDPKPSKKRILEMEKDFIMFPFERMSFSSLELAKEAIVLYRTYKSYFFIKYSKEIPSLDIDFSKPELYSKIRKKIVFLKDLSSFIKKEYLLNINISDDIVEFENYKRESLRKGFVHIDKAKLSQLSWEELEGVEPLSVCKQRARRQVLTLSVSFYIDDFLQEVNSSISIFEVTSNTFDFSRKSISYLFKILHKLNLAFKDIDRNIFKYYNESIDSIDGFIFKTRGSNRFIKKINKLVNILDVQSIYDNFPVKIIDDENIIDCFEINRLKSDKNIINLGIKRDKKDSYNSRVHGILLPVKRVGNEKMSVFYYNIICENIDITNLFCDKFYNILATDKFGNSDYFKCLMLKEIYNNIEIIVNNDGLASIYKKILGIESIDKNLFSNDFYVKDFVNNYKFDGMPIDKNRSSVLVSKTRTDNDSLVRALGTVSDYISNIEAEYNNM